MMFNPIIIEGSPDSLPAGAGKINDNFVDLYRVTARHHRPQLLVEGDSIPAAMAGVSSQSFLFWCGFNPRDYSYDPTSDNYAVPGSLSDTTGATDGLLATRRLDRMVARIKADKAAGVPSIIVLLNIGMNGNAATLIADVRKAWSIYRAAGADQLIIQSVDPSSGAYALSPNNAAMRISNNCALGEFARQNASEVQFADSTLALAKNEPNNANDVFPPIGDASNSIGSTTFDGIHGSGYGAYLKAKALMACLARVTPPAPPSRIVSPYATGPRGNLLGAGGRFSTGGASPSANTIGAGVIGIENYPTNSGGIGGGLSGDLTCTITRVPYTPIVHSTGRIDVMATRFTFAGTPTSDSGMTFGKDLNYGPGAWDATTPIDLEADVYLDALTNFRGLNVRFSVWDGSQSKGISLGGQAGNSNAPDTITVPATGHFRPRSSFSITSNTGQFSGGMSVGFPAGRTVSGSLEVLGFGAFLNPMLPLVTA